ncbi:chaperonin 10-like protein [Dendryphion nanum]|uniref:Chaperonin 10-like protein n=1 Tax=Dendryphion nanum TaxID=256645 RepID=A0A9P9DBM2_9PLEO|nr:chaperonin 10-like protein [Dendryphion nanum]
MGEQSSRAFVASFGGPEKVSIVTAEIAAPAKQEVQVKVNYSAMGGADIAMREGLYPMQKSAPLTLGYCLLGRVHKNGPGSSKFKKGDLVASLTKYDSQAELANVPEKYLIPVPENIDQEKAIALVVEWTTAYGMTLRSDKIKKGDRVFIHGLSGAVGHALVELCLKQGADVYGTAAAVSHDELRAEGVTPFVYTNKDWIASMKALGGVQHVMDALGFESWDESWSILASDGGHLIGYGGNGTILEGKEPRSQIPTVTKLLARGMNPFCPKSTTFFYIDKDQSTFAPELQKLFQMLLNGEIQVRIKKTYTLDQVPEAHANWTKVKGIGSVIVKVADDVKGSL